MISNINSEAIAYGSDFIKKVLFTLERSKEETQEKNQDQTLRAEAIQSLYNK
jgi:hypothetical protein